LPGKIQAIRGMHDILPDAACRWRQTENAIIQIINSYGYQEIRLPIVEKTELFSRSIGEFTDIVTKEMYTFRDRNDDALTLRPEATAGCVRAGLEHGLFHNQIRKLWYIGPMFRHERPQKGRQRQFHQIGIEAFGIAGPDIDAEMIILCARVWRMLQLPEIRLELNNLGTARSRFRYREILIDYFSSHRDQLDEDSLQRLRHNPLRILDSKNPSMSRLISMAPAIHDFLDTESEEHFAALRGMLEAAHISYVINPRLVRGLDYYSKTVFEWTTGLLGAQGTVCAGGRFDGLAEQFGGRPTPAIGCAMGMERLMELICRNTTSSAGLLYPHVYLIVSEEIDSRHGLTLAETLRDRLPGLRLHINYGGGSFKSQFKKADSSGALLAVIMGPEELGNQTAGVKSLRSKEAQETVQRDLLAEYLRRRLGSDLNLS
jgi:histidyl-tRNA synthetase